MIASPVCAPNVVANDAHAADGLADDDRRDLVEARGRRTPRARRCRAARARRSAARAAAPAPSPSVSSRSSAGRTSLSTNSSAVCRSAAVRRSALAREDALGRRLLDQPDAATGGGSDDTHWSAPVSSRFRLQSADVLPATCDARRGLAHRLDGTSASVSPELTVVTRAQRSPPRPCRRRRTSSPGRSAPRGASSRAAASPSASRRCSRADGRARSRRR